MKLAAVVVSAALIAAVSVPSTAFAFSQEPLGSGTGGGNALADPADAYRSRVGPDTATERAPAANPSSPFSFGVTGPNEPRLASPVERPGVDNEHLFWNNSSRYWK
ncbi:MAG TPA: hypothetical protein VES39_01780 [Rhodospirillales bacterium]|nr:hypothetical protein [Rhodospirillales bacterium]